MAFMKQELAVEVIKTDGGQSISTINIIINIGTVADIKSRMRKENHTIGGTKFSG
jgi:hypothetical protein